ncbi:MAG: SIR2 family protein [Clostridium sp.]|nr:SIR2 family protein [Clostridium sp.]
MEQSNLIKVLLKNTNINFLLGAGTSFRPVEGKEHFPLMSDLLKYIKSTSDVLGFYNKLREEISIPPGMGSMLSGIYDTYLFAVDANVEKFLSVLEGVDLYIVDDDFKKEVEEQRILIRTLIRKRLKSSDIDTVLDTYIAFYNGLKNLKEVNGLKNQIFNIFTTNYDMMNEIAMETQNIHYYSGFEGIVNRKFNLAYYNYDFVDNFQVNQATIKVTPNHMNLFKVHGSLSWFMKDGELVERNPYEQEFLPEIIYPSVDKFSNTNLIISYSALMRELSNRLCREKTTLFVSGMSMGDEHINKIIENALTINTFHMVLFCATEGEIKKLKEKYYAYKNVIVVNNTYKFSDVADLLLNLQGGDGDA